MTTTETTTVAAPAPGVLPLPTSTYQLVMDAAARWPDAPATQWIADPARPEHCVSWTYAKLAESVTRIANAFTALGVGRDDAVTLCGVNTAALYAATLAAEAVGIAAPVNPALQGERIVELVRRTGSRVLVAAGPELNAAGWQGMLRVAGSCGMDAVLALRPDGPTGPRPPLTTEGASGGAASGGAASGPLVAYLDDVVAAHPRDRLVGAGPPAAQDLAAFVHTGGTTGSPKIAAQTHGNQLACARGIALSTGLEAGEGILAGLPLFHVNALLVTGLAPLFRGNRVVWPGPLGYRDPQLIGGFWKVVEQYRIAAMSAVPTVYGALLRVPVDADIGSLRLPIVGASPLPTAVRDGFARHTGVPLCEGYGLTEATCASTVCLPDDGRPGSVGRALPGQQVKAVRLGVDGTWQDCGPGEAGVLVIGGPAVFAGSSSRSSAPTPRRSPGPSPASRSPSAPPTDHPHDPFCEKGQRHERASR